MLLHDAMEYTKVEGEEKVYVPKTNIVKFLHGSSGDDQNLEMESHASDQIYPGGKTESEEMEVEDREKKETTSWRMNLRKKKMKLAKTKMNTSWKFNMKKN